MIPRLAIIGLGLIGGSFSRALRAAGEVGTISGYDHDAQQLDTALNLGVIDHAAASAAEAVADAAVVLIAVPVLHIAASLDECLGALRADAIITDVGSTKGSVLRDIAARCGEVPARFVAAHPIAGTEKSGVANATVDLFRGKRLVITPHPGQDPKSVEVVAGLWRAVGARVVEMTAEGHDDIFAATSHLPHVLAYAFVDMLSRHPDAAEIFPNAGGGFRDFTRIASSKPELWHDIVQANAPAVLHLLREQITLLEHLHGLMAAGDWPQVLQHFERARAAREQHLSLIE